MNWSSEDNRHYRGHLDRIYVSQTESWEINYYIKHYLEKHYSRTTAQNMRIIGQKMESYPGRAPVKREDMTVWLDKNITFS
jgi:hypothetical protein